MLSGGEYLCKQTFNLNLYRVIEHRRAFLKCCLPQTSANYLLLLYSQSTRTILPKWFPLVR